MLQRQAWWLTASLFLLLAAFSTAQADSFRIGAEDDWYPFTAWRDGKIQGMSADIVRSAFAAAGAQVELQPYPYARCMELTRTGQLVACFNTTPDARIAAEFRLPKQPLFSDDILLWARAGTPPLADLDALAGRRVAVTLGYEYGPRFDSDTRIVRVPVRRDLNGFLMLQRSRVDYVVAFRATTRALLQAHPELTDQFVAVATVHRPQLFLSVSRHHPQADALLQRFEQGMQQIKADGRYQQILDRWQRPAPAD